MQIRSAWDCLQEEQECLESPALSSFQRNPRPKSQSLAQSYEQMPVSRGFCSEADQSHTSAGQQQHLTSRAVVQCLMCKENGCCIPCEPGREEGQQEKRGMNYACSISLIHSQRCCHSSTRAEMQVHAGHLRASAIGFLQQDQSRTKGEGGLLQPVVLLCHFSVSKHH